MMKIALILLAATSLFTLYYNYQYPVNVFKSFKIQYLSTASPNSLLRQI